MAPASGEYVPAAQLEHEVAAWLENHPALQVLHAVTLAAAMSFENEPAWQGKLRRKWNHQRKVKKSMSTVKYEGSIIVTRKARRFDR